jgi:hypothetical protein
MKAKYRVINKSDNVIKCFSKAHDVAIFLLGRRVSNYLVIKSGEVYADRLVLLTDFEISAIEKQLESA